MNSFGGAYYNGTLGAAQDYKDSFLWFSKAAAAGNAVAMHNVALLHENGRGTAKDDKLAFQWYLRAAQC